MKLKEIRERTRDILQIDKETYSDARIDRAAQMVLGRAILRVPRLTHTSATATVTASKPEVDISAFQSFRRERYLSSEVAYVDQGTWTTSTAYALNELVTGDGTPDALFYRCTTAHTSGASTQPGDTGDWQSYWQKVAWKGGWQLSKVTYSTIAMKLNGEPQIERVQYDAGTLSSVSTATPEKIGFKDDDTVYLYPVPDSAYTLRVFYTEPLLLKSGTTVKTWVPGRAADGNYEPNIPDEHIDAMISFGIAPMLDVDNFTSAITKGTLDRFDQWLNELRGLIAPSIGVVEKDENCYL